MTILLQINRPGKINLDEKNISFNYNFININILDKIMRDLIEPFNGTLIGK